jgi:hypothetical protein
MWTMLGGVLLVLASALAWAWLKGRAWKGKPRDGYELNANFNKSTLVTVEVGVRSRTALEFELRREGRFDRFAKAIGLAVEPQVGRAGFDDALYLAADVPRVPAALRRDRELADALQALFAPESARVRRVARVVCRGGVLVLTVVVAPGLKSDAVDPLAAELAPALVAVARRLAADHPGTPPPDPMWWRATLVLAIASGILAHGFLDAFRLVFDFDARTLDPYRLWAIALPVAGVAVAALAALGLLLLGRSSRAHRVLAQALLLAVVGAPFGAMAQVRDLNMEADRSPVEKIVVQVAAKIVHTSSKGGHTYVVVLTGWPAEPDGYELNVRHDDFDLYLVGDDVTLVQREGYLGLRWLASATPGSLARAMAD